MGDHSSEKGVGEQSVVERSIGRRPVLGALGGLGIAGGISGRVGAQEGDDNEWPETDDAYYAGLVEYLEGEGLPPAEFVHGDTESDARSQYWVETSDFGTAEELDVSGDEVPFSEATRFEVTEEPDENWDVQLRTAEWASDPYRSVDAGDVMLGVAYLRAPEGEGTAQYVADNSQSETWNAVASDDYQEPPAEWQRYFFPIEFDAAADGGLDESDYEWSIQFHLGFDVQTVDVGGIALFDFGHSVDVAELPSGAVSDDYDGGDEEDDPGDVYDSWPDVDDKYYAGLIDELSQRDIAPGRFVYAETEADTFAAYELVGANVDLAERSPLDVSEDDVPFAEATRIEVGELEDDEESLDPWGVNFQASVEERAVSEGDALLGVAYLRTPQLGGSSADVTYKSTDAANESSNYVLNGGVSVGQEWQRYFFPIGFQSAGDAGEWWTEFWVGVEGQTVDVGGVALLSFAGGVEPSELPSWDSELDLEENWEEAADQRIRDHRTAELTVEVTDDGDAVEGAEVDVSMVGHEFTFGTAVNANRLQEEGEDADRYRSVVTDLFNAAVLENNHKWRFWEENRELADDATDWLLEQGLDVRGHVALWAAVDSWAVPTDVVSAMGVEWEDNDVTDPELDPEHVERRSFDHLETVIDHYGDDMIHWDVVNEVVHEPAMIEAIDGEDVDPVEAPVLAEWYRAATEVAPDGVELDVNDYNTLVGPYEGTRDDYERQIEFLAEAEGVDLGGIGMQSHFSRDGQLTPSELLEAFDRYAAAGDGAALRITEFDMGDPNWPKTDKADFFRRFLKTAFSHPDVEDFLMWGFWDDAHWEDDAPLFESDWSEKPSYDVYTGLVFDEWWTEETGSTDEDGRVSISGFRGEYEVTVTAAGLERTETVALSEGGRTVEVDLAEDDGDDDDSGSDGDDSDGDDGLPGFGVVTGLASLGATARYLLSTSDDEQVDSEVGDELDET
ncbi:endo-1,4-beta-xylanase [Halomontanus rarus]|uniref:endo-1,4-beta-xylanase n=1 Tax=Halomontanus rarus TaxID=3034020 RepID=UPI001A984F3E